MKFTQHIKLKDLASELGCEFDGDADFIVTGINEIHVVQEGEITFVDHPKYYDKALKSNASVVFIDKKVERPEGKNLIFHSDPFSIFKKVITNRTGFNPQSSSINETAKIGKDTVIQPGVFIGEGVEIGANCLIHANVVIYHGVKIGDNVIIHSNTTIGADAFYMKRRKDNYEKFPSCGTVLIEDDVEIGAGCTIDKGVTAETKIGKGTKIDNQVHIGHDTVVGKHCIIAAQVGISGIVRIEDFALIWGQVGIDRDITIGEGAVVLGKSGVMRDIEPGKTVFGTPAGDSKDKMKEIILSKRLQELFDRVDKLENQGEVN